MDFAEFRKKNEEQAPKTPDNSTPADSEVTSGETQKDHQNKDLLKMKMGDGSSWIWKDSFRSPDVKSPDLPTTESAHNSHHKVKIHYASGKTETRLIDDTELGALKKSKHITKVMHLGRSKANGKILEYVMVEKDEGIRFKHKDGRTAILNSYKYADPSLGSDHYVHFPDTRATVYPGDEGLTKAHKLLKKLGYVKAE